MRIFHQLGHNHNWNIESLLEDNAGDGLILAPRYMKRDRIEGMSLVNRERSLFDPQFFLPDTQRGQLATYDFFPDVVADGFETSEYSDSLAQQSALRCVRFQIDNWFQYIVIPTRHVTGMPSTYQSAQENMFVLPFLEACRRFSVSQPIILQMVLTDHMLKDEAYFNNLLNWVTGFREISGVYIIVDHGIRSKQVKDLDLLIALLRFVDYLKQNELIVILGYLNTEAFLLSIASPDIISIGSYEGTRIFNIKYFQEQEQMVVRGPTPRIYVPKLLQLINHNYINVVRRATAAQGDLFEENQYKAIMFRPTYQWHFSKAELYKDYFVVFSNQLRQLTSHSNGDRYHVVSQTIQEALHLFATIEGRGVVLDSDSDGSHLPIWLTAANEFAIAKGWR